MGSITFIIKRGVAPFTATLIPASVLPLSGLGLGEATFYDVPESETPYSILVTDSENCTYQVDNILIPFTTTTSTEEPGTTTTSTEHEHVTTTTTIYPSVECLDGLSIELIYLKAASDLDLIPPEYLPHPDPSSIGMHFCNRALFEVYGNGIYIGDSRMNNTDGVGGGQTSHSGNNICEDYHNMPDAIQIGGVWTGDPQSRYDKFTITEQQAIQIAMANNGGTIIQLSFVGTMETYHKSCDAVPYSHENITWMRVYSPIDELIYSGCPSGNFLNLDICPDGLPE